MSDGPHKSLNMRRGWKRLSERADNRAFDSTDVREALPAALEGDWHAEIPPSLSRQVHNILEDPQASFLMDHKVDRLEALRTSTGVQPLASVLLDCAIGAMIDGLTGDDALRDAIHNTLADRATRGARQAEEHHLRQSTANRAIHLRARIEEGIAGSDISTIATRLIAAGKVERLQVPTKQTGLDDGVTIV